MVNLANRYHWIGRFRLRYVALSLSLQMVGLFGVCFYSSETRSPYKGRSLLPTSQSKKLTRKGKQTKGLRSHGKSSSKRRATITTTQKRPTQIRTRLNLTLVAAAAMGDGGALVMRWTGKRSGRTKPGSGANSRCSTSWSSHLR